MNKSIYIIILSLILSACAAVDVSGYKVPGEDLKANGTFQIILPEGDDRGLSGIVANGLKARGLALAGEPKNERSGVDYKVQYGFQWQWDITWYLLNFDIRIYNAKTNLLVASAHSLRTSLVRKSPEEIVDETIEQIIKHGK